MARNDAGSNVMRKQKRVNKLPTIKRGNKRYYFDARLDQLRNVDNPHDFIDLSPEETMQLQQSCKHDLVKLIFESLQPFFAEPVDEEKICACIQSALEKGSPWIDIRMKGIGTLHFIDEHKRPRELKGTIIVDYRSLFQAIFVKIEVGESSQVPPKHFLMPFAQIIYIEWELIEQ